ncbi:Rop family plasmid primer RNA-binding protein [Escherichia coli]|nr:Rop family plasmid primer RNA-binding protein [Escherichia coli]
MTKQEKTALNMARFIQRPDINAAGEAQRTGRG